MAQFHRRRRLSDLQRCNKSGFTLLEVVLAIALSVLVLGAIASAIHLHLNILEQRRYQIEKAHLARNVLQMIARDIRSAVQFKPVDMSDLETMMSGADLTSLLSSDAGMDMAADMLGGDDASGGGGIDPADLDLGALAGGSLGAGGGDTTGTNTEGTLESANIGTDSTPPSEPGIYGNQFELQIDVSRLPRKDEYNPALSGLTSTTDIPSDIKTIAYYLDLEGTDVDPNAQGLASIGLTGGLVRRTVDRAVARYVTAAGGSLEGLGKVDVIAPEVTELSFQYFDGEQWLTEWDTNEVGGLPFAIEVTVWISDSTDSGSSIFDDESDSGEAFRLVVHLPIAEVPAEEEADSGADPSADGSMGGGNSDMGPSEGLNAPDNANVGSALIDDR